MRRLTISTLAIALAASVSASAQTLNSTNSAHVWLQTKSGPAGLVDFYVNGQLVARNMFPYGITFEPMTMPLGNAVFLVVPAGMAPGTADLMSKSLNVATAGRNYVMVFSDGKFDEDRYKMDLNGYRIPR
ncbi:hypothetical protein [Deinococcus pimensis]|uniref:hypothetical protein n=1 Tax=Deinococcus pimensis TaxID=309888 RepID=UPI000482B022|nr:hypothetical protein [Deinococcus pimensis]